MSHNHLSASKLQSISWDTPQGRRGPVGTNHPNKIVCAEIAKPEWPVYAPGGEGDAPGAHFRVTATFAEQGGNQTLARPAWYSKTVAA